MLTFFAGQAARGAAIAAAMVTLAGCETSLMGGSPVEGIGFREARNAEITAILEYRACRDEAVALAVQAREAASPHGPWLSRLGPVKTWAGPPAARPGQS